MIDLSFLTEAEQEAILKVLNRDAELKKAEDERVRHLHDVVDNENEFKYKSGQWFYDAKSRRHRDKIHGADLVRASIRKRKKPTTTLAELGKDSSKRRWLNSVNQDLFIPPELFGVMEAPDEAEEDVKATKEDGNQSSKTAGFTSPDKGKVNQGNGIITPGKQRQNPFNSGDLPDYRNNTSNQTPQNGQVNGTAKSKSDLMSSLSKYGVKLPYPELTKGSQISQKANDESQTQTVQTPVPKPRTLKMNSEPQNRPSASLRKEDSANGTGKPRGILKRRSSTSSTDSESIWLAQSVESNKTVIDVGQNSWFDEHDISSDSSTDRLKQVRFSEKVHQRPPTPNLEPYISKEFGEYGILDPGLLGEDLNNGFGDHHDLEEPWSEQGHSLTVDHDDSAKVLETNDALKTRDVSINIQPASMEAEWNRAQPASLENDRNQEHLASLDVERNLVEPEEVIDHLIKPKISPDISIDLPTDDSTGEEALYAVVKKTPPSSQEEDFDLDDALMEPRFHPQRGKTIAAYQSERPLEFGKSFGGEGKLAFKSNYPEIHLQKKHSYSSEEENTATSYGNLENGPSVATKHDDGFEAIPLWRRPSVPKDQDQKLPSDSTKEQKTIHLLQDIPKVKATPTDVQNLPHLNYSPGEQSSETKYRSMHLQNRLDEGSRNNSPVGQNGQVPFKTGQTLHAFVRENKGRKDLPKSANFKVMSLNERIHVVPSEQMSNPSQFQNIKHFWNVEERNPIAGDADISPNKLLTDFLSRNKSPKAELQQRHSELPAEKAKLPDSFDSLSEEEQTSQKVASWLAQTPAMEEVTQMDRSEDRLYHGDESLEGVQQSTVADKTEKSARRKARNENFDAPRIIEAGKLKTEDIQVPQETENLMDNLHTTVTVSPIYQTLVETKPPAADFKISNKAFYDRILQISNKQSPVKEAMPQKNLKENIEGVSAPAKKEYNIGFERLKKEYDFAPMEVFQKQQILQASIGEEDEVIEKSVASESRDKQDFISSLKKLEIEASEPPHLPKVEAETEDIVEKSVAPESRDKLDFISSLKKLEVESLSPRFLPKIKAEVVEVVEKSKVPENQDKQDFITALHKLEIEASILPLLTSTEAEHQDNLPEEEIQQHTVHSVNSSFKIGFENFIPAKTSEDQPEPFWSPQTYPSNEEHNIKDFSDLEETVEKTEAPVRKDEELGIALKKLEHEALEHQPDDEDLVHLNYNVALQSPKSQIALQTDFMKDHSAVEDSSITDEKRDYEQKQSPNAASALQQIFPVHLDINEHENRPVAEEPIQRVIVETQESSADFHNRLMRLQEVAMIPEEPEDLLEDDTITVSPFPNREVFISKKVYSSIESLPPVDYPTENETHVQTAFTSPGRKSKELKDLESQKLAGYHGFPSEYSGSYTEGTGSVLYKKPEVRSTEALNSKKGKPAVTESPSDASPSKGDKYEFEAMKAQDESISKVLDWFNRSSDIGDLPLPVGKDSNVKTSPFPSQISAEEESGNNQNNLSGPLILVKIGSNSDREIAAEPQSALPLDGSEFVNYVQSVEHPELVSLFKDKPVPPGKPLKYGNGGGFGKISNQAMSSVQKDEDIQESNYLDNLEDDKKGINAEEGTKDSAKDTLLHVETKLPSSPKIPESSKNSQPQISDNTSAFHPVIQEDEKAFTENRSPLLPFNTNLESGNTLELGLSEDESVGHSPFHIMKNESFPSEEMHLNPEATESPTSLEIAEKSEKPNSQLSLGSTSSGDHHSGIPQSEDLTLSNINAYNASPPEWVNSNLEADYILKYGKSGGGSGKTSSQEISEVFEKPQFRSSLSNTESIISDHTDVLDVAHSPADIEETELIPSEQEHLHLDEIKLSTSRAIPQKSEMPLLHVSVGQTENGDRSPIKDESLTPSNITEYSTSLEHINASEPGRVNSDLEAEYIFEYGKSGGGFGKTSSQQISELFEKPQFRSSLSGSEGVISDHTDVRNVAHSPTDFEKTELVPSEQVHFDLDTIELPIGHEIPEKYEKPLLNVSVGITENTSDHHSPIKDEILAPSNTIKDSSSPEQINLNLGHGNIQQFEHEGGSGQEISETFKTLQSPLKCTASIDHAEVVNVALSPVHIMEDELVPAEQIHLNPVAIELPSSPELTEESEPPHCQLSPGSTDDDNDHSDIQKYKGLTQSERMDHNLADVLNVGHSPAYITKDEFLPSEEIHSNLEATESLTREEVPEISEKPHLQFSSDGRGGDDHISDIQQNEYLTLSNIIVNNASSLKQSNSNLEAENILAFGKSGSGFGKTSSQKISEVFEKPQLRSSSSCTESINSGHTDVLNVAHSPDDFGKHELVPPEQVNLNLDAIELPTSQEIPQKYEEVLLHISVDKTENTSGDHSPMKDESLTPSNPIEDSSSPKQVNSNLRNGNIQEFEKHEGGSGNALSQSETFKTLQSPLNCTSSTDNADVVNVALSPVHIMEDKRVAAEQIPSDLGAIELPSSPELIDESEAPHLPLSSCSTDYDNDHSDIQKCEGLTQSERMDHDFADVLNVCSPVHIQDESLPSEEIALEATESPSSLEIPEKSEKLHSKLTSDDTGGGDVLSGIQQNEGLTLSNVIANNASPLEWSNSHLEAENILEFGKSGSGSGKTSNQKISEVFEKPPFRSSLSSTESINSDHTDVLNVERSPGDFKKHELDPPEPVHLHPDAVELPTSQTIPQKSKKTLLHVPVGKTKNESLTPFDIIETAPPPEQINSNLRNGNIQECDKQGASSNGINQEKSESFGKSQSGSPVNCPENLDCAVNDAPSPVHPKEDQLVPAEQMHLNLVPTEFPSSPELTENSATPSQSSPSSTENGNYHSNVQKYEGLTLSNIAVNNDSPPEHDGSHLGDILKLGKHGGGSGKFLSQEIPEVVEKPVFRLLSSTESLQPYHIAVLNVAHSPADIVKQELLPFEHVQSNQEIPQISEKPNLHVSVGKPENTNDYRSDVEKDEGFTQFNSMKNPPTLEQIPSKLQDGNILEFGKNDGESIHKLNHGISKVFEKSELESPLNCTVNTDNVDVVNAATSPVLFMEDQLVPAEQIHSNIEKDRLVMSTIFNENIVDTKLHAQEVKHLHAVDTEKEYFQVEKQEIGPLKAPVEVHTGTTEDYTSVKEQLDMVRSDIAQKKVGDLKLLWEGERPSQPTMKTIPNRSQRAFSPSDVPGLSRTSSVDSDDHNTSSLVTFKKVTVTEDEESVSPPIDQLKSFWENEAYKETSNVKPLDKSSAAVADITFKIKRLTLNSYFETEHGADGNLPGRSVSLSESVSESIKNIPKSATFQSLRSFWNVDGRAKRNYNNPNDRSFLESKKRQFRSNPDLSKESYVAKIKSKLDSKSLMDIREDAPTTSHFQSGKAKYDSKNRPLRLRKFSKEKSGESSGDSMEAPEPFYVSKNLSLKSVSAETLPKEDPPLKVSQIVSDLVVKSSAPKTATLNEQGLTLQSQTNEYGNYLKDTTGIKGDNGEKHPKVYKLESKPFLVKQTGFDAPKSLVDADVSFVNGNSGDFAGSASPVIHETFEKTIVQTKKSLDFDQGLQKLYNESLEASLVPHGNLNQNEVMDIQKSEENFSKVLTVSSGKIESGVQNRLSKDNNTSSFQPIVIDLTSKMMHAGKDASSSKVNDSFPASPNVNLENLTSESIDNHDGEFKAPLTLAGANEGKNLQGKEQCKKEVVEQIEIPTVRSRALFTSFDEGLKKLYEESRDLKSTYAANSKTFQDTPAELESLHKENVDSSSPPVVILKQELSETVEKTNASTKMPLAKSLGKLQKEEMNEELGPFMEHVPSYHVVLTESQPKFSDRIEETTVQDKMESPHYDALNVPFMDTRQSTPLKENGSLRRSTVELYLAAPYRREISKSMDFEFDGYIASDAMDERCMDDSNPILNALKRSTAKQLKSIEEVPPTSTNQLNSSNPEEHITENSFPENAEKFKRMSQSVPTFLQDETDGRDTDSASESSFQLGRHRKTPSSLTNLSGSSGMASMSSVSGSVMSVYSGDFGNVDVRGSIEFSVDYVEQLKEFLIYIYQCRDLAAADVKRQRSDPYVKAYLLPEKAKMGKRKSAVKKKTLNPVYNEILRYKIPKESLLAQTLNLSVWHHDALGRNSFLGEVNMNLATWNWSGTPRNWYPLEPRTPAAGIGLTNRGELKLALKYIPWTSQSTAPTTGTKQALTGEVHIWIKECIKLPMLRDNKINSFVKCTVLPDTSRKSRQKTRTVDKTTSPIFNHTMVYDGFKEEDLREACVELTVWDHNRLSNHFIGGLRIGLGTGKSYGTAVDWMDSTPEESIMWEKMMSSPNTLIEGLLPLRMFKMAKLAK